MNKSIQIECSRQTEINNYITLKHFVKKYTRSFVPAMFEISIAIKHVFRVCSTN